MNSCMTWLDIDERRDVLGILARQEGQQPLKIEMDVTLAGLNRQNLLVGYDELAQPVYHLMEHIGGHDTIAQQFLSSPCLEGVHLFASSKWHANGE
jgi:hypothetical protein